MHLMVDVETCGATPGSVVTQIGWAWFDEKKVYGVSRLAISIIDQLLVGLGTERGTLRWWSEQTKAAQDTAFRDPSVMSLDTALMKFAKVFEVGELMEDNNGVYGLDDDHVWANPDWFDLPMIQCLYSARHLQYPWPRRQTRDARTLLDTAGMDHHDRHKAKVQHDAGSDAEAQALDVIDAWKRLSPPMSDVDLQGK